MSGGGVDAERADVLKVVRYGLPILKARRLCKYRGNKKVALPQTTYATN